MQSAGLAVKALTTSVDNGHVTGLLAQPVLIEEQKDVFQTATSQYFTLLSSVDVNIRRQIYALEEADILPAEAISKELPTSLAVSPAAQINPPNASSSRIGGKTGGLITGGGLGNLDVGWLNSRNDNVGKEMNAELWEEAQSFISKLEERNLGTDQGPDFLQRDRENEGAPQELESGGQSEST